MSTAVASEATVAPGAAGIILFAHGARNPDWARPLEAIREAMLEQHPAAEVALAFLEFIPPNLPEAIDRMVARRLGRIVIVPVFMAHSGHTKRDLPALLEAARSRHPGLDIRVATPIGEAREVVAAIARYALACGAAAR